MIRGRTLLLWPIICLILIVLLVVGTGLWIFGEPFGWVRFCRGSENYRMDFKEVIGRTDGFEKLHAECASLARSLDETNYCLVWPTNLPPVLGSLRPQIIQLHDERFMDVQVNGGFNHRGLLVSLDAADTNVPPSHRWFRRQIAPGVYEYKE